ncbi:MAG TPA: MarR family transcriptional regulator [Holophagaceae bacterium]|jgi:DNA-binding MarR family transcriptional regulator|nr:MarR family transcriptional regulator [Holophagaceae bacterium]
MDREQKIEAIFHDIRRIVRALELFSKEVDVKFHLTAPQLWALWELGKDGPLSLKDLSARIQLHPSTVVGVVDRLEAKGLVTRKTDTVDRRRVKLSLTAAGRALRKKAPHPAQGRLLLKLQEMGDKPVADIHKALLTLVKAMEAEDVEARFFFSEG